MSKSRTIKVLLVDDSPTVRAIFTRVLSEESDIEVVGGAKDPYDARELIIKHRPNVIILDVEMPRMDGLTFLKKLVAHYPVPVIMCSGVAPSNSCNALEAIESGAIDVVAKPSAGGMQALRRLGEDLAEKIRAAAMANPTRPVIHTRAAHEPTSFREADLDPKHYVVAIGASTGGTEAIKRLLSQVPADFPPVVIVQHMPEGFTRSFAERLDQFSPMTVREAREGDQLAVGLALLARGGIQMSVRAVGGIWRIEYGSDEPVNRHCPSVDVLFDSVGTARGRHKVGILLTGMGADGAKGLLRLRQAGATTFAQNEQSCVVFGMPKVAIELGAAQHIGEPTSIPLSMLKLLRKHSTSGTVRARV